MMKIGDEKTNGKSLVEMQIPVEEVENIDAPVSEGYYGCRSVAISAIVRLGAVQLRSRYWGVTTRRR